jgi:amidase
MTRLGAYIVDPFVIPDFDSLSKDLWSNTFQFDVNNYLASLDEAAPYKTIQQIFDAGLYSPYIEDRLKRALEDDTPPEQRDPPCLDLYHDSRSIRLREAVLRAMDAHQIDAFVYPTWSNPPRKIGDMESPAGDNSQILSPHTGLPAITVPMGFVNGNLPAGMQIVGKLFREADLIKFAYAFEQATKHRRPPESFPSLR